MYITNNLKHYEIDHDVNNTESLWCTIQTAHGNSVKLGYVMIAQATPRKTLIDWTIS